MIAAVILCGLGYAEGAVLSRRLGGWQVISWALLVASPLMLALAVMTAALSIVFLRGNLEARFGDMAAPVAVLGAGLMGYCAGAGRP